MEVLIDPDVYEESKIPPTIIIRIVEKWKTMYHPKRAPQDKWVDPVEWENVRYVLTFRNEPEEKCVVTACRRAHFART